MNSVNFLQVVRQTRDERIAMCLEHDKDTLIGWLTTRDKYIPHKNKRDGVIRTSEIPPSEMIKTREEYEAMSLQALAELVADRDVYESPLGCTENETVHTIIETYINKNGEKHTQTREIIY